MSKTQSVQSLPNIEAAGIKAHWLKAPGIKALAAFEIVYIGRWMWVARAYCLRAYPLAGIAGVCRLVGGLSMSHLLGYTLTATVCALLPLPTVTPAAMLGSM